MDFKGYKTYPSQWPQELDSMDLSAGTRGDARFYYSGMAQAVVLDRLNVDWQPRIMTGGVWLEDLLQEALSREP